MFPKRASARVDLTNSQERLALKGDEPLSPRPANRKFNNFLPYGRNCVLLLFMILAKENAALSVCLEAAPPVAPSNPSADARAARLAKFKREQRIVEYLNRGVSIVEIAAQVGVGEKRMRAIVREIMDRRMPHPPREFVAIQVSRLNEALLVAYSAMSLTNLKAVDQVVKIVRELDRYHGFASVARRVPEAPRSEALVDGTEAYGAALVCQARYEPQDFDDMDFDSAALPLEEGRPGAFAGDDRPENPPQAFAKTKSAPGNPEALLPLSPRSPGQEPGEGEGRSLGLIREEEHGRLTAGEYGPENQPQSLEMVESAPDPLALRSPGQEPGEREGWRSDLLRRDGPGQLAAVGAGERRPENPPQTSEKIKSAPEIGRPAEAAPAPAPCQASFDGPMILTRTGWKPATMRMLQNGVAA